MSRSWRNSSRGDKCDKRTKICSLKEKFGMSNTNNGVIRDTSDHLRSSYLRQRELLVGEVIANCRNAPRS